MKKTVAVALICISLIGFAVYQIYFTQPNSKLDLYIDQDSIQYMSKVDSQSFYIYKDKQWKKEFVKGVNLGAAKPGYFPGEFGITKADYTRWFQYISDMNANTIRVYTILKPDFYNALYEFNQNTDKPLYLIQGVWMNEENIAKYKDAFNPEIANNFMTDMETTIDVLHGNKEIKRNPGYAYGVYDRDVSPYVLGYVLGIEWDPEFVKSTNEKNNEKDQYDGTYLYSEDASPFEIFLCETGDHAITYETDNYSAQKPVSFTNWVTTDMLAHPNEPLSNEDMVSVNMEKIKIKNTYKAGIFASYHIYPYYPDSMNYQKDYINYKDKNGKINTYRAYLKDLKKEHTMPVLVAEFGVPSSRGKAHENIPMGFNQGNISEKAQGEMDAAMLKDIYEEGYAGGLVFSFQDEWFKRTWNTMDLDLPDRRPYWNNQQTNEQHFGLLAFDPGEEESTCYIDRDIGDWTNESPLSSQDGTELYVKSDDTYVYFMIKSAQFNIEKDSLVIPIDTIANQGNLNLGEFRFERDADFIITIHGKDKSKILVDPYYDSFQYIYGAQLGMIPVEKSFHLKNSGEFVPIYLCLNKELYLPEDKAAIPFQRYETGELTYGDANPSSSGYNSLADFCVKENHIEIRIPWQLLNVMDPSTKMIMNDLHLDGIKPTKIQGIYAGAGIGGGNGQIRDIKMNLYSWNDWDAPIYHERLKSSYYILKDAFAEYE